MDRDSHKKIIGYGGRYLVFAVLFSVFMYAFISYEASEENRKMLALLSEFPDWEAEIVSLWKKPGPSGTIESKSRKPAEQAQGLQKAKEMQAMLTMIEEKYGYPPNALASNRVRWMFWGAGLLIGALATGVFGYCGKHSRYSRHPGQELQELYECLEQFRKGDFLHVPECESASKEWMRLWETVRELGLYFSGLKEKLKQDEDSTKALITDISHQLKTPLASLKMSQELAAGEDFAPQERKEFQEQEAREIEKMEMLLDELVNLSRLETHMIQIHPVPAGLKETITAAVSQIYMKAKKKQIDIQVDMDKDIDVCHDTKWTVEAFANVLDNAVKYSKAHTVVTVRVQRLTSHALIEVEDEGIGIEPKELVKIYQRFYRGSAAKEIAKDGAGVGLYLSRMILERQGGTISTRRKMEKGTVFRMTLPCYTRK